MGIVISELSFNQTNRLPYEVDSTVTDYPIAPLVFAENTVEKDTFRLHIVAYIPSDISSPPLFIAEDDGNPIKVSIAGGQKVMARSFIIEYDDTSSKLDQHYILWNIDVQYRLEDMDSVDYILTRVRNIDPKTSRGTVTTVQEA